MENTTDSPRALSASVLFAPVWTLRLLTVAFILNLVHLWGPWPWCLRERVLKLEAQEQAIKREQQVMTAWTVWLAQREEALNQIAAHSGNLEAKPKP